MNRQIGARLMTPTKTNSQNRELLDNELDAVSGGTKCTGGSASGGPVSLRELAKILGELEQAQAGNVR